MGAHRPSPALVVATVALVVALGGVAYSAIPDPAGVIHACRDATSGVLRVEDTAIATDDCTTPREVALAWNQQGPAGAAGPAGPAGPTGPAGTPALPPAFTKFLVQKTVSPAPTNSPGTVVAKLEVPEGRYVVIGKTEATAAGSSTKLDITVAGCLLNVGISNGAGGIAQKKADDFSSTSLVSGDGKGVGRGTIAVVLAHDFEPRALLPRPGVIELRCLTGPAETAAVTFRNIRLVAMRVAELPDFALAQALSSVPKPKPKPKLKAQLK